MANIINKLQACGIFSFLENGKAIKTSLCKSNSLLHTGGYSIGEQFLEQNIKFDHATHYY
jgi:hypothetical protein